MKFLNQILREYYSLELQDKKSLFLGEDELREMQEGAMYLTTILQRSDTMNGNGRIYPHATLFREVENYKKLIREGRSLGELDHPESRAEIYLRYASHMITEVWWDERNSHTLMGKIKVLSTPSGKILRSLVEDGVKVGISSRAVGSLEETQRGLVVMDDLKLICFDMVATPSTENAFALREALKEDYQVAGKPVLNKGDNMYRILRELRGYNV